MQNGITICARITDDTSLGGHVFGFLESAFGTGDAALDFL